MSNGRLQKIVANYRQQLKKHESTAEKALNAAYQGVLNDIQPTLDRLYKQIKDKQANGDIVPLSWLYEEKRLENIKALITRQMNMYGSLTKTQVAQLQHYGVQLGSQSAQALLQASVPSGQQWTFGRPSVHAIEDLISATQPGSPLNDLFGTFGEDAAKDVSAKLITGITLGMSPTDVARGVASALDISRARALTISRTEMLRAYRSAALENYRKNDDVVGGWIWLCALLRSSCAACVAMNGTKHTLEESMDSHPNCACTQVPETKSWSDILGPLGIDTSGIEDTTIDIPSGSEWLDQQSTDIQRDILGAKFDGWSNNDFTLSDIVGTNSSTNWGDSIYEKSLKQLTGGK